VVEIVPKKKIYIYVCICIEREKERAPAIMNQAGSFKTEVGKGQEENTEKGTH
jgi:hypothetical protein